MCIVNTEEYGLFFLLSVVCSAEASPDQQAEQHRRYFTAVEPNMFQLIG